MSLVDVTMSRCQNAIRYLWLNQGDKNMGLKELFGDISAEIDAEDHETLSPADKKLHQVAQRLLRLERDLKVPGVTGGVDTRLDRLLEEIAKEKF
jgi:hypothetical protein